MHAKLLIVHHLKKHFELNPLKNLLIILICSCTPSVFSQLKDLENIQLDGDNFAEYFFANYTKPMDEGSLYGLTEG